MIQIHTRQTSFPNRFLFQLPHVARRPSIRHAAQPQPQDSARDRRTEQTIMELILVTFDEPDRF
jgi:hypothetical protein